MRPEVGSFRFSEHPGGGGRALLMMQTNTTYVNARRQRHDSGEEEPYGELRIWGRARTGHSVLLRVHNFKPYF